MRDRFGGAVARAEAGDVDGFAHALKKASYYTADETKYASALRGLSGKGEASATPRSVPMAASPRIDLLAPPAAPFQGSLELGRVLDAIARHPTTIDDTDPDDD
jgi:hypothetical protein